MSDAARVTRTMLSAPLPQIIERLGVAVAEAQNALDRNSIAMARALAEPSEDLGGTRRSLLSLGFVPTFYAFTEATVEAKLSFSLAEGTETRVGGQLTLGVNAGVFMAAATVDASYARRFSVSAEGTSSIAARLVALPAPAGLTELLRGTGRGGTTA